jgi:hypothetical protein
MSMAEISTCKYEHSDFVGVQHAVPLLYSLEKWISIGDYHDFIASQDRYRFYELGLETN